MALLAARLHSGGLDLALRNIAIRDIVVPIYIDHITTEEIGKFHAATKLAYMDWYHALACATPSFHKVDVAHDFDDFVDVQLDILAADLKRNVITKTFDPVALANGIRSNLTAPLPPSNQLVSEIIDSTSWAAVVEMLDDAHRDNLNRLVDAFSRSDAIRLIRGSITIQGLDSTALSSTLQ